ncbi:TnsA-like heteromeric transposase endonuclease subunit [Streptomyces eurythermus]|uniref:TnsA-like heteromeric transposase endonuclease subunit n=1 Tax=Streptomyces eurythermus TaxID=42237 RepID=UPI0036C4E2E3
MLVDVGVMRAMEFAVAFTAEELVLRREPLPTCWTSRFERARSVRAVRSYTGQGSVTRDYWSVTTGGQLSCESQLERHHAMLLDFDPEVTGLAAQPFRLFWPGSRGRRGHVPDFFARFADGSAAVVDVRPDDRIEPADAEAFAASARL